MNGNHIARRSGWVYLVGAGPGDPGLLTLKGKMCLEAADVVVYDALVSPLLLDFAPSDARVVYVGKRSGRHCIPQKEINELLIAHGRAGRTVARLKGGDPFIFGRGAEEVLALARAGIPFEVVPGVSSGHAVPAYAGIPLTYRDLASVVTFVTGHEDPNKKLSSIRWDAVAAAPGTLVIFMGLRNLKQITSTLVEHGRDAQSPAAAIQWGTTEEQITIVGVLADIAERVAGAGLNAPVLVVIGEVVKLRPLLRWFEEWAPGRAAMLG